MYLLVKTENKHDATSIKATAAKHILIQMTDEKIST